MKARVLFLLEIDVDGTDEGNNEVGGFIRAKASNSCAESFQS